ncbi:glycoside hydrolase [Tricharina praecox]|uniref:glycoside hydrolase n=1 Tax=Tricharina praecox TaxID=43433 RepID=UPI002220E2D5|nr:glycoside hydrolase [Tricharina praecox]KAI5847493.1 glycoside hydrolase [Tricharina praecox]
MRFLRTIERLTVAMLHLLAVTAYDLDPTNKAYKMMQYYPGNRTGGTPGIFGVPIFWWESGAIFGSLIDYWYYTGNSGYNDVVSEAIRCQVGEEQNFMPSNQSHTMGNDDQCFWALTAMAAAERNFANPRRQAAATRWDPRTCGGGLRWQTVAIADGYNYKNTISNGCFFNIAVRLARYTGNDPYAVWAEKTYDWLGDVKLINATTWDVHDDHQTATDCSDNREGLDDNRWSYNLGILLSGSVYLYNYTNGESKWKHRVDGFLNATDFFFKAQPHYGIDGVLWEPQCERWGVCDIDQKSFKAYMSRFLALAAKMAPFTDRIMSKLRSSAIAAAKHWSGYTDGNTCGMKWTLDGEWDGTGDVGHQLSALETIQSNLIFHVQPPLTHVSPGANRGSPGAGGAAADEAVHWKATMADEAGAWILTAVVSAAVAGTAWWMAMN